MNNNTDTRRMQELVELLNRAAKAYYQDADEIMSNYEYDALYDELQALEAQTGVTLSSSPTVNVGYEILSELPKERHPSPMLSLDKTKDVAGLQAFAGDQKVVMSWKMDGLTIVLTYRDGGLVKAVTREMVKLVRLLQLTPEHSRICRCRFRIRVSWFFVVRQ